MSFALRTAAKDAELGVKTLLLMTLTWADGTIRRYSTIDVTIDGNTYAGRILEHGLSPIVAMDPLGIDRVPVAQVQLADANSSIWQNDEHGKGHSGATMTLTLRGYDFVTDTASTDSDIKLEGRCKVPNKDNATGIITLTASNGHNTQQRKLPDARRQSTCFKLLPFTADQQADSLSADSPFRPCGWNPGGGRGTASATPCGQTKEGCVRLGMFALGTFAGVTFFGPQNWRGREYVSGTIVEGSNSVNPDAWGAPYPMPYGTGWVKGVVENVLGDANTTRFEVTICVAKLNGTRGTDPGSIIKVVANEIDVPFRAYSNDKTELGWEWTNNGSRDGAPINDAEYKDAAGNLLGDPHGSKATIEVVVPRRVAGSDSVPRVEVLLKGPALTYGGQTGNPVWILADIEQRVNRRVTTLNLSTFTAAAAICDVQINYKDASGATTNVDQDGTPHRRFETSYALQEFTSAADLLSKLRASCNAYLDYQNGMLAIRIEGPLGEQQPSPIAGSNNSSPISSTLRDGSTGSGYSAYDFGPSSIRFTAEDKSSLRTVRQQDGPNVIQAEFQDKNNDWQVDSLKLTDPDQIELAGAEFTTSAPWVGANTVDQNARLAERYLAKLHRGNLTGDPTGSLIYKFETSIKAEHLRAGHIVRLSDDQEGLTSVQFRVQDIEIGTDSEDITLTVAYHDDAWYEDTFGQLGSDTATTRHNPSGPPKPWGPALIPPFVGDPLYDHHDYTFDIEPDFNLNGADGAPIPAIHLVGSMPVNKCSSIPPPVIAPQASITAGSGPFVGPSSWWIAVCASDSDGSMSRPSILARADIPTGITAVSITVAVSQWHASAAGYSAFVGRDPRALTHQGAAVGTPSTITVSHFFPSVYALPDPAIVAMRAQTKRVISSGVFQGIVSTSNSTTITVAGVAWTTNQWAGRVASILSTPYLANFAIVSNTANVLTVTPNPVLSGGGSSRPYARTGTGGISRFRAKAGDILVIRAQPSITVNGDNTITFTDGSWDLPTTDNGVVDYLCRIIAGTGRGKYARIQANTAATITTAPFTTVPDSTSVPIIEGADWKFAPRTANFNNALLERIINIEVPVDNYPGQVILAQVLTLNGEGVASDENLSPFRETWIAGSPGLQGNWSASTQWDLPAVGVDVGQGWAEVNNIQPGQSINLSGCRANVKVNPTGTFEAKWYVSRDQGATFTAILAANLQITAGNQNGQQTALAVTTLYYGDYLRLEVVSVGGAAGLDIALIGQVNN